MRLKSVELVNALSAAFEQLQVLTQTSVSINQNVVQAEQGQFVLFAKYFDTLTVEDGARPSDQMVFEFFKPLTDNAGVAENATNAFLKVAADYGYILDDQRWRFIKAAFDEVSLSDAINTKDFGKPLYDVVAGVGDQAFVFTKKVKADIASAADQINTKGFGKALADASLFLEAHRYDMGKLLADTYSVLEAHSLEPGKVLYDEVAGIGSYVFIFTKKAPDDTFTAVDQINTFAFGKTLVDSGYLTDAINTIYFDKAPSDAPVATDAIDSFSTTKQLLDGVNATDDVDGTASILDDQEMQFLKDVTHVASVSESLYRQVDYARAFTDAGYFGDDAIFDVGKAVFDAPRASDSTNLLTGKHIYDIPVASETLAYALARVRSDSALLGDAKTVTAGKVLLDLASSADAGSLRSQGFTDFTYFAEDYVGASRTF